MCNGSILFAAELIEEVVSVTLFPALPVTRNSQLLIL